MTERITAQFIHQVFDEYVDAGLIGRHACDEICRQLDGLFQVIDGPARGEDFWVEFQKQFGFFSAADRVTPMNAANLCPEPTALIRAANSLRLAYNENVAQQTRTRGQLRVRQIQAARERLAKGLGIADPNDLALIRNSSEGNNAISCGFRNWRPSSNVEKLDTVVVWAENHPTNLEAWRLRRDWHSGRRNPKDDDPRRGDPFRLIVVDFDRERATVDEIIEAFTSKIDERTRFVSYTETSNGSGCRLPEKVISAIWTHAQKFDCHVHVDGTMSWGALPVDLLKKPYCHSFVSSAHKWFLGPKETAVFYMAKDKVENFAPSIFAYDYKIDVDHWDKHLPDSALRFELIGQRDDVNLITLDLTQMMWTALADRQPYARVEQLGTLLYTLLEKSKWKFVTPSAPERRWGIVRVEAPVKDPKHSLYAWLYANEPRIGGSGGSEKSPSEHTFRLCPHIYNTESDVHAAVVGMNRWRELFGA